MAAAGETVMERKAECAMDQIDKQILAQLQVNAAQPVADIASKVGLSVTPCWPPNSADGRNRLDPQASCIA